MKHLKSVYLLIEYTPLGTSIATSIILMFTALWIYMAKVHHAMMPTWIMVLAYGTYGLGMPLNALLKRRSHDHSGIKK